MRPAVVLAESGRGDWILCQVTSNPYGDPHVIRIVDADLATGSLNITSYARPGKLFTAHTQLRVKQAASLKADPFRRIIEAVVDILHHSL
jgi:hypothetical protein